MNFKIESIIRSLRSIKHSDNILKSLECLDFFDFNQLKESIIYQLEESNTKTTLNKCIEEIRSSRKDVFEIMHNCNISHDEENNAFTKNQKLIYGITLYLKHYYLSFIEQIDQTYFNDIEL
jgi:hypothetical protein